MKTLAVRQPWATLIAAGDKTIEVRAWRTDHRGPLLIVASGKPLPVVIDGESCYLPAGCQICVVDLIDCRPLAEADLPAAYLEHGDIDIFGQWAWIVANPRAVVERAHKGRLRLYDTADAEITFV